MSKIIFYRAFSYYRLSKEDFILSTPIIRPQKQIKDESNSITNQKGLIHNFLQDQKDIELVDEFIDDGYTGLDFERPSFQKMMSRIVSENINCIIVKDFSRLGRDYLENCRYIERIFPKMGIRFISINDGYDGATERTQADNIIIPFKNLMNENYSRDNSVKIRSHMLVKRKTGDYIAPFAAYGYKKNEKNYNQLIPDPYAAAVVANIFRMKISGMSQKGISEYLNKEGVLPPCEYKEYCGSRFTTSFKQKERSVWSENMISRILTNRVYIGDVEQGKIKKINYKTNVRKVVPEEEWIICENKHQSIVDRDIFLTVQYLLKLDTRVSPGRDTLYLFSGLLYCADCKTSMVRRPERHGGKEYVYHLCSSWKNGKRCSSHRINEKLLYEVVLKTLQSYIRVIVDLEKVILTLDGKGVGRYQEERVNKELEMLMEQESNIRNVKLSLYEDYKKEILDFEEYEEFKLLYKNEDKELKLKIECLKQKKKEYRSGKKKNLEWIEKFKKYDGIQEIDRSILALLVHHIDVFQDRSIKVVFHNQDEFENIIRLINTEV